jgi:hypothetical protein
MVKRLYYRRLDLTAQVGYTRGTLEQNMTIRETPGDAMTSTIVGDTKFFGSNLLRQQPSADTHSERRLCKPVASIGRRRTRAGLTR